MHGSFDNYYKIYLKFLSEEIKNSHHFDNFTYKNLGIHPITLNELKNAIKNVYKKFNILKLMQKQVFIDYFLSIIFNASNVKEEKLFKLYHKLNNDIFPLYVVYCCKIFNIKWKKFKEIILK